jgi:hypothetical protein
MKLKPINECKTVKLSLNSWRIRVGGRGKLAIEIQTGKKSVSKPRRLVFVSMQPWR